MSAQGKYLLYTILVVIPVLTAVLWLASGHEVFSKSGKAAQVTVSDPLFGDTTTQTQFVRGPILGYFVGLDAVAVVTAICLAIAIVCRWVARRRRVQQIPGGAQA
jgi:hypothetical protein